MNARTRLSAKGQVVLPQSIRTALDWHEGKGLEVVRHGGAVTLRPVPARPRYTAAEAFALLAKIGPAAVDRVSDEEMDRILVEQAMCRYPPQ
jgi:AbrB family looped-hinge helix DNA binding protein